MHLAADLRHEAAGPVRRSARRRAPWARCARACRSSRPDRRRIPPRPEGCCPCRPAAPCRRRCARAAAPASPDLQRCLAAREREAARGTEPAGRLDLPFDEGRAADEPGDEPVGRALVEVLLRAHLPHGAIVHDHQPVGHRQGLLLVVGDHDGREPELASAARGSRRAPPGAAWHRGWRAARRAAARPAGRRARGPAPPAAAGRRKAGAAGARPDARGGPAAGPRRCGGSISEARPCASPARRRRSAPPSDAGTARSSETPARRCASTAASR